MSEGEVVRSTNHVDDTILRYSDSRSPEEISVMLNGLVSPAAVAAHAQNLLKSRDWLTDEQQQRSIIMRMRNLLNEIEDMRQSTDTLSLRLKTMEKISGLLEKRKAASDVDLNTLYGNNGALMGRVVDQALTYMKRALRDKVDPQLWDDLVVEAVRNAQMEIAKHQALEAEDA